MNDPAPFDESVVLSPEWLSSTIGARVRAVEVVERLETVATKVRFRVEYDDGDEQGSSGPGGRVDAFCVKAYFNPDMRARVGAGEPEARFYTELAPTLPIRVPPCVYAAIDPGTGHALVLMEDLQLSPRGTAWKDVLAGRFDLDGELPINPDGGLKSFGHPVGASGLRMLYEAWLQLRGEAPEERRISTFGERDLALTHNLGGYPGEMVSFVSIVGTHPG